MSAMDDDDLGLGVRKVPKVAKVKNKTPAPVQITAEQLLREAKERELELVQPPPKQKIADQAELKDYQMRKRKAFEDGIRKNRSVIVNWIKYASWEESQQALRNARSVYERALDVDHRNITIWLKYAEMEMRHKQINSARNVWDRAVTLLPRANQFWYKYTYMEELLKNVSGARQVFERWMDWEPEEQAWHSYINFELRCKEIDRARVIYERFVLVHPTIKNWIKYAKFEEKKMYIASARQIYERGVEYFGDEHISEQLFIAFAKFEESQKEHERARIIYKYALDHLPKDKCELIYKQFTIHEKKFGSRAAIEDVIVSKRKFAYEEDLALNPFNYDTWFDYLRMLESDGTDKEQVRMIYERAIGNVPPSREKRHWRRYIYLWISYAVYEELNCDDVERTREVYKVCLDLIPHKIFTFAKIWIMAAQFEVRQKNLAKARKILGNAIGQCPKEKLFREYIELEIQLREFHRCRILYEKFLEFCPENCCTWMKYAELEVFLGEFVRARAIYELAISQTRLDMPEVLWKGYIDFEVKQQEYTKTTELYKRLLTRTSHVKVWISFAKFELSVGDVDSVEKSRQIYREANRALKESDEKEERVMLLEDWNNFEKEYGTEKTKEEVRKLLPNIVKRRQKIQTEIGVEGGWQEFYDYIFPDDQSAMPNLKLLAIAKNWKNLGAATIPAVPDPAESSISHEPHSPTVAPGVQTERKEFVAAGIANTPSPKLEEFKRKHDSGSESDSSNENDSVAIVTKNAQTSSDSESDHGDIQDKTGTTKPRSDEDKEAKEGQKITGLDADKGEVQRLANNSSSPDDVVSRSSKVEIEKNTGKRSRNSSTSGDETKNRAAKEMRTHSSSSSSSSSDEDEVQSKLAGKQLKNRSDSSQERRRRRSPPRRSSLARKSSRGSIHSPEKKSFPVKKSSPPRRRSPEKRRSPERKNTPGRRRSPERRNSPERKRSSEKRNTQGRRRSPERRSPERRSSPRRRLSSGRRSSHERKRTTPDRRHQSPERGSRSPGRRRPSPGRRSRSPPRKRSPMSSRVPIKRGSPEARKPTASHSKRSASSSSSSSDD